MKKYLLPILCALPIVGVILWFVAGKNLGTMATLALVFACPLSHVFLMKHDHKEHDHKNHKDQGGEKS